MTCRHPDRRGALHGHWIPAIPAGMTVLQGKCQEALEHLGFLIVLKINGFRAVKTLVQYETDISR